MSNKKKSWPKIGTIRRNSNTGAMYIKLEDGVSVFLNGEEVSVSKSRTVNLQDPRKKLKELFDNGFVSEKDYQRREEILAENDWLRYELVVPPARD